MQPSLIRQAVRAAIEKKPKPLSEAVCVTVTPAQRTEAAAKQPGHENEWLIRETQTQAFVSAGRPTHVEWDDDDPQTVIRIRPKTVDTLL